MLLIPAGPARAEASCAAEAAALAREAEDLPQVELANPTDTQNTCITLETNMDFAARMLAHGQRCPGTQPADTLAAWSARKARDGAAFAKRRCRRSY